MKGANFMHFKTFYSQSEFPLLCFVARFLSRSRFVLFCFTMPREIPTFKQMFKIYLFFFMLTEINRGALEDSRCFRKTHLTLGEAEDGEKSLF